MTPRNRQLKDRYNRNPILSLSPTTALLKYPTGSNVMPFPSDSRCLACTKMASWLKPANRTPKAKKARGTTAPLMGRGISDGHLAVDTVDLTEAGSLTSHAAVLARSLAIPTVTGVAGLLKEVHAGDPLIVDATEGVVRVRPARRVVEQFLESDALGAPSSELPDWAKAPESAMKSTTWAPLLT